MKRRRIRRFLLWLLPAKRVRVKPEVCSKCGTAGCPEDKALDW